MTDNSSQEPVSAADLERLAGLDRLGDSAIERALARSREALHAWGTDHPGEAMPADVATRLDEALAAAAAEAPATGTVTTIPSLGPHRAAKRSWWPAAAAVAAGAVVLAGVGIGIGALTGGSTKKHATIATAGTSGETITLPDAIPVATTSTDYQNELAVGADVRSLITGGLTPAPDPVAASVRAAASQAAAGKAPLSAAAAAVPAPQAAAGTNRVAASPAAAPAYPYAHLSTDLLGGQIAQCLQSLDDENPVVGVEKASYKGKPSLFIAFRDPAKLDTIDIFIVGASCDAATEDGFREYFTIVLK